MIELVQFPRGLGVPNASPFCMRVEALLRLQGVEYKSRQGMPADAPMGKLPFVKDGEMLIGDSSLIIEHLQRRGLITLDEHLSPEQIRLSHLVSRMCCEHLVFALARFRWLDDASWLQLRDGLFGFLPPGVRQITAARIRNRVRRNLEGQGVLRYSEAQVLDAVRRDLQCIEGILQDAEFMFGAGPAVLDATVYAFLANLWHSRLQTPLNALEAEFPLLAAYALRRCRQLFPELVPCR